jgi:hypothetical protein
MEVSNFFVPAMRRLFGSFRALSKIVYRLSGKPRAGASDWRRLQDEVAWLEVEMRVRPAPELQDRLAAATRELDRVRRQLDTRLEKDAHRERRKLRAQILAQFNRR